MAVLIKYFTGKNKVPVFQKKTGTLHNYYCKKKVEPNCIAAIKLPLRRTLVRFDRN